MVTTVERSTAPPQRKVAADQSREQTKGPVTESPTSCPRCHAQLSVKYDEALCMQCGYVDYDCTPQADSSTRQESLLSSGTRSVLRYVGEFRSLAAKLIHVKLIRVGNRVVYAIICPFCDGPRPMIQSSLSSKRKRVWEERYKCVVGHRVSLTSGQSGALGWK